MLLPPALSNLVAQPYCAAAPLTALWHRQYCSAPATLAALWLNSPALPSPLQHCGTAVLALPPTLLAALWHDSTALPPPRSPVAQ
jgi:hypothetical protein